MSIYEKRWHYSVNHCSTYTDDTMEVLAAIDKHGVEYVSDGYADEEWIAETSTQIGGTLYTRRTERVLTAEQFVALYGPERQVREDAAVMLREALAALESGMHVSVAERRITTAMQTLQKERERQGEADKVEGATL